MRSLQWGSIRSDFSSCRGSLRPGSCSPRCRCWAWSSATPPACWNVNRESGRGEVDALLGGRGGGKSPLMRAVCGRGPPLTGQVFLFGESLYEIAAEARDQLRKRIGVAFQQDALFSSMTIED